MTTEPNALTVGDRAYFAALDAAAQMGALVRAGVLSPDHPAVAAAVVAADALQRIRAGEPEPFRTDQADADRLLAARHDPYATLAGITVKPTGAGGVMAVCAAALHDDDADVHALIVNSLVEPVDLADLAHMAAAHRAAHVAGGPLCTCPTGPVDGATRRTVDQGCPEHGRVARAFAAQERYDWLIDRLARAMGAGPDCDAFTADPEVVITALLEALEATGAALAHAETQCRIHKDRDPSADAPAWHGGCEECRQPRRMRRAIAAWAALADYRTDPWSPGDVAGELADVAAAAAVGPAPSEVTVGVLSLVEERLHALHPVERGGLFFVDRAGVGAVLAKTARELLGDDWADLLQAAAAARRAGDQGPA